MTNPILDTYRNTPAIRERETFVDAFDEANGTAWLAAGQPDDLPGTEWWAWETEAMRAIETEHGKPTARDVALAAGLSPAHFVECPHNYVDEIGHDGDGSAMFRCRTCGDTWNEGADA